MTIISLAARRGATFRPVVELAAAGAEMSTLERAEAMPKTPAPDALPSSPPIAPPAGPIRVHGKFFFAGAVKHFVKGVTYGPFGSGSHGAQFPEREVVERDFALMMGAGVNTVRVFTVPPLWLLDMADAAGLKVLVGLPWAQHV